MEERKRVKCYCLGRSRSSEPHGRVVKYHLNWYVNTIHTWLGGGFETMQIYIVEIYGKKTGDNAETGS